MKTKMVDFNYMGELQLTNFGESITPLKYNDKDLLLPAKGSRKTSIEKKKRGFKKKLVANTNKEIVDGSKQ